MACPGGLHTLEYGVRTPFTECLTVWSVSICVSRVQVIHLPGPSLSVLPVSTQDGGDWRNRTGQ